MMYEKFLKRDLLKWVLDGISKKTLETFENFETFETL